MHRIRRVQGIQPEVLIHWYAAGWIESILRRRPILVRDAVPCRVLVPSRLRIRGRVLQNLREDAASVELEDGRIGVVGRDIVGERDEAAVEVGQIGVE